jgi:hypothetical protein
MTMRTSHQAGLATAVALMTLAATACMTGPSAKSFDPVRNGGGIYTKIKLDRGKVEGELFEVQDTALVLGDGCVLTIVPYAKIKSAKFDHFQPAYQDRTASRAEIAELKRLSRFPGGMPREVYDRMLACAKMTSPSVVGQETHQHPGVLASSGSVKVDADSFLAIARRSTGRYQELDSAIVAGYRKIGGDLPSLGEHWILPSMVMSGSVDPARPGVLIYMRTAQGARLAGVAWTVVLHAGDPYPDQPVGRDAWHEHNGSVDEETLPLNHHAGIAAGEPTRVAILHAWIWIENPRGVWVADNWALPFVRAGLTPGHAPLGAARALSLTTPGAVAYYERVVSAAAGSDPALLAAARSVIETASAEAKVARTQVVESATVEDLGRLSAFWDSLWTRLEREAPALHEERIRHLALAMR